MRSALANFQTLPLKDAARQLLSKLGYKSDKFLVGAGSKPQDFLADFVTGHQFDEAKALVTEWKSADLLFQLTDQELSRESNRFTDDSVQRGLLKSYIFIAIELKGTDYARGKFSAINWNGCSGNSTRSPEDWLQRNQSESTDLSLCPSKHTIKRKSKRTP